MSNRLYSLIWNRENDESKVLSLIDLLSLSDHDMEQYAELCGNRIANAELIDGEHVQIDFFNFPNLFFDSEGLKMCHDILCGYIPEDKLLKIYDDAKLLDERTELINQFLNLLRSAGITTLVCTGFFTKHVFAKGEYDEEVKEVAKMSRLELFSRSPFNRARSKIVEFVLNTYIKIRYKYLFDALQQIIEEAKEK